MRTRVKFTANNPVADGAGGFTDDFDPHDLGGGVFECWAKVELKRVGRTEESKQTQQERKYKITTRATFGYVPDGMPKKNMRVEIIGYTTGLAVVHGVVWDDWNNLWVIEAVEKI